MTPGDLISIRIPGSPTLHVCMRRAGWKGKLAADKSQVWKQGDQTDGHRLLAHPPLMHNHLTNVFTFIAEVRSISKVRQHREEEARSGRGWEETGTLGRKPDTSCRAEQRAGLSSRELRDSVPTALAKEQSKTTPARVKDTSAPRGWEMAAKTSSHHYNHFFPSREAPAEP